MAALSVVSTCADCSTNSLPVACAVTVAEPSGLATELTDALPTTGESAAGSGVQPLMVGTDTDPGGCPSRAAISAASAAREPPSSSNGRYVGPTHCVDVVAKAVTGTTVGVSAAEAEAEADETSSKRSERARPPAESTAPFRRVQEPACTRSPCSRLSARCPCGLRPALHATWHAVHGFRSFEGTTVPHWRGVEKNGHLPGDRLPLRLAPDHPCHQGVRARGACSTGSTCPPPMRSSTLPLQPTLTMRKSVRASAAIPVRCDRP